MNRGSLQQLQLITCEEAKRGQHKIRALIDLLHAPLENVLKT